MKLHQEQQALFRQDLEEVTRTAGEAPVRREEEQASQQPAIEQQAQLPIPDHPPLKPVEQRRKKGKDPKEPKDRTWLAIRAQLEAMGGDGHFEIGFWIAKRKNDRAHLAPRPDPAL